MMELSYRSATELLQLLDAGDISSVELVKYYFNRIDEFNVSLNAVVQQSRTRALIEAARADSLRRAGQHSGILHGLPCTVKESFNVKGFYTTSGAPHLRDNLATDNALGIQRLLKAGAIIMGKTNVSVMTTDWQAFNEVYGTTNSPWDLTLTPGGSSGGAAVSVAADFTSVEFCSDLFGSMRMPAHYTGVYAHRCSLGLMSVRGHIPGNRPGDPSEPDLSAAGPMARCAADLRLMMRVLYAPWIEPPRLPDFTHYTPKRKIRVCTWFQVAGHELDSEVVQRYQAFVDRLRQQPEIEIDEAMPSALDPKVLLDIALKLSGRLVGTVLNSKQRLISGMASLGFKLLSNFTDMPKGLDSYAKGMQHNSSEQQKTDQIRREYCQLLDDLFNHYDVLLIPVSPVVAFPHMQYAVRKRRLMINGKPHDYNEQLFWNTLSTVFGLPATIYPLNKAVDQLPCGIQIIAGHFCDDIAIDFAQYCEGISGGFTRPPGY